MREQKPIPWKTFVAIRKLNVKKYFQVKKIKNFEDFARILDTRDVSLPDESEISQFYILGDPPKTVAKKKKEPESSFAEKFKSFAEPKKSSDDTEKELKLEEVEVENKPATQQKLDVSKRVPKRTNRRKKSKKSTTARNS